MGPVLWHSFCNQMGFPAIGSVLQHPQRPVILLSYQLGVLLFLILLFPFTDPAFYDMTHIRRLLLTPRSACALHIFTVPGLKCTSTSLKNMSMKDSKSSMLLSWKDLTFPTHSSAKMMSKWLMFHFLAFLWFKLAFVSVAHSNVFIFSLCPIFLFHSAKVISCHVVKLKPDADVYYRCSASTFNTNIRWVAFSALYFKMKDFGVAFRLLLNSVHHVP